MTKPTVYLLLSLRDHRTYLGSSDDLERRLQEHDLGKVRATKYRRPLKLVYTEGFNSLLEARKREKYYKSCAGRKKLRKILEVRV